MPFARGYDFMGAYPKKGLLFATQVRVPTAMLVSQYLEEQRVAFETVLHPPAFTAQKRARFLHVPGRQVVKCVLLNFGKGFILAILRSIDHVDLEALSKHLGASVRLADEDDLADQFRDCERGAGSPFGSQYGLWTLLEESIHADDLILFEAQQHAVAIRMKCRDFEMLERPTRCRFACQR
jgi:Ala-tRNA(Pro) deacylase